MFYKHRNGNHGCGKRRHKAFNCNNRSNSIEMLDQDYTLSDTTIPLNTAPIDSIVQIVGVIGCQHINHRLAELGLSKGCRINILQSTGTGPVIVLIKGSRIALGQGMSEKILVKILNKNH